MTCLVVNFTKFVILDNLTVLDLALSGVKELCSGSDKNSISPSITYF